MVSSMEEFVSAFQAVRTVSTPLVAVRTVDPASTTQLVLDTVKQARGFPPLVWVECDARPLCHQPEQC
jgi:hypothetical protein